MWFHDPENKLVPYDVQKMFNNENRTKLDACTLRYISNQNFSNSFESYKKEAKKEVQTFIEKIINNVITKRLEEQWALVIDLNEEEDFISPPFSELDEIKEWLQDPNNLKGKAHAIFKVLMSRGFKCGINNKYRYVRKRIEPRNKESLLGEEQNNSRDEVEEDDDHDKEEEEEEEKEEEEEIVQYTTSVLFLYADWSNAKKSNKRKRKM